MKLKQLNDEIRSLSGARITFGQGYLTYKSALISICEMHQPEKPATGDPIKAFSLGTRLVEAGDELEITEDDLKFLKHLVDSSMTFVSVVLGQINKLLESVK
jgi:hypothetical protein